MYLKKNDKIILLVGIVIIVIAGIGIAMYNVEDTDDSDIGEDKDYDTFSYTWIMDNTEKEPYKAEFVNKGETFEETFEIEVPSNSVLTNVEFTLSWMDDVTYMGIFSKGYDTLDIMLSDGSKTHEESITYSGSRMNKTFNFNINSIPDDGEDSAESQSAMEDSIKAKYKGKNKETFDITVTVQTGEKLRRLIKFFQDKGNDFDLIADCTYYTYDLQMEDHDDDDDMKETGDDDSFNHNIGEFYRNLGYGRGMI